MNSDQDQPKPQLKEPCMDNDSYATLSETSHLQSKASRILDALVYQFNPLYFVITMGTGITSATLYNFPIDSIKVGSRYVGLVYFFIDLIAFFIIHILFILRYFVFYKYYDGVNFMKLLKDPNLNIFLGTEVMGMATLINMVHFMKPEWYIFTYVLWLINVIFTLLSAWVVTFYMFSYSQFKQQQLNATILLPIVTLTVAASTGSLISPCIENNLTWRMATDIICYMLWSNAILMGLSFFSIIFYKLLVLGLPPKEGIFSTFIPVGILGQGSFGILLNFNNFRDMVVSGNFTGFFVGSSELFNTETLNTIGSLLHLSSCLIALFLLSMGICMTVVAILSVIYYGCPKPWIKTMWAATFPLGTMGVGFAKLHEYTGLVGFQVMSTVYSVALIIVTTYCIVCTALFEIPWEQFKIISTGENSEQIV